jgi:hypothetical protein
MAFAMCDHPLGNIIEFHLPFVRFPTIRASLGASNDLLGTLLNIERICLLRMRLNLNLIHVYDPVSKLPQLVICEYVFK